MMALLSRRQGLRMRAIVWRFLMSIGMRLHKLALPRPPPPSFVVEIPSRLSSQPGNFKLAFYVPPSYDTAPPSQKFPVVVNFHGGGFSIGSATDDARWAHAVTSSAAAVFVSVGYRLAPEHPFPAPVQDSTDAVIYLATHAASLRLDPHRIALSGFSAGGNFVFTIPLLLHDLKVNGWNPNRSFYIGDSASAFPSTRATATATDMSMSDVSTTASISDDFDGDTSSNSTTRLTAIPNPNPTSSPLEFPSLTLTNLLSFYPILDFRIPRASKTHTQPRPDLNLPAFLTEFFDESYMAFPPSSPCHPSQEASPPPLSRSHPLLSPAAASDRTLRAAYPDSIVLFMAEYDMLCKEGAVFAARLQGTVGKKVVGGVVAGVRHGFDKGPWGAEIKEVAECYGVACRELREGFTVEG